MNNLKAIDLKSSSVVTDKSGKNYLTYANGQVCRLSSDGSVIPRVRLSKKERRKLRKEYKSVENVGITELADKISKTSVVSPTNMGSAEKNGVNSEAEVGLTGD